MYKTEHPTNPKPGLSNSHWALRRSPEEWQRARDWSAANPGKPLVSHENLLFRIALALPKQIDEIKTRTGLDHLHVENVEDEGQQIPCCIVNIKDFLDIKTYLRHDINIILYNPGEKGALDGRPGWKYLGSRKE